MYLEYYNLREKPFSLTPDPGFLYYSNSHRRAIAFLRYGLQESKGFLQLTGPVGSGKTTLLRAVLSQFDEKTKTAYIINPCASFPELLRAVMKDLEIPHIPPTASKMELLDVFHEYLLVQVRRNTPVIIIFDEAQNLSLTNLEEIRMLSNFETSKEKLLQIIFVGQPEFIKTLDLPELRQLKQRIQVRYHLTALRMDEVREYIKHRLHVAGSDGRITFTEPACAAIFSFSGGIPRLINAVCDIVLLIGYVTEKWTFAEEAVDEAVKELEGRFDEAQDSNGQQPDGIPEESEQEEEPAAPPQVQHTPSHPEHAEAQESAQTNREKGKQPAEVTTRAADNGEGNNHSAALSNTVIGGLQRNFSAAPNRAQGHAEEVAPPDAQPAESPIQHTPLNSYLRHRTTRKFRATASGLLKLDGDGSITARLKQFIRRHSNTKDEATSSSERAGLPTDLSLLETLPEGESHQHIQVNGMPRKQYEEGAASQHSPHYASAVCLLESLAVPDTQSAPTDGVAEPRCSSRLELKNKKVIICLKDGGMLKGTISRVSLESEGITYVPASKRRPGHGQFVSFADIAVVHFVANFKEDSVKHPPILYAKPKGREVVVALVNGEVICGITLNSQSSLSKRFYVISLHRNQPRWSLIEKSGAIGILSETQREGIYAEEFETLAYDGLPTADSHMILRRELAADKSFSLENFSAAMDEYQEALRQCPDSKRLAMKLSLCRLNLGIQHLRANRRLQAKDALEKVNTDPYLFTRALKLVKSCDFLTAIVGETDLKRKL